jgi:hypothetical protein
MRNALTILLLTLALAACDNSRGELLEPVHAASSCAPVPAPVPAPTPAPITPALHVSVAQIVFGNPGFSGPQDAWHAILEYDYTPDPAFPCVVVKTYYQWGGILRQNVKIWDCSSGRRVILDDFYDYAWAEPLIEYSVQIFTASVAQGDWHGGFCMGAVSDYWGTVDPAWLYCPIDGQHPNGLRIASGIATAGPLPVQSFQIRVTGYLQVTVQ